MDLSSKLDTPSREPCLLTNISYEVEELGHTVDTPVFHVRGRTADGSLVETEIEGFRPYFGLKQTDCLSNISDITNDRRVIGLEICCDPALWKNIIGIDDPDDHDPHTIEAYLSDNLGADIYHTDDPFATLEDEPAVRVFCRKPSDVGGETGMRGALDCQTFEADIPFERRFLITSEIYRGFEVDTDADRVRYENWPGESDDSGLQQDIEPCEAPEIDARLIVYDIEVATEGQGFPEPERATNPITAISAYDSYDDEYRLWGLVSDEWDEDPDEIEHDVLNAVTAKKSFPRADEVGDFSIFDDETRMLEDFHGWVLDRDPDVFTGYNSDGFDHPYLIQRSYNVQALSIKEYGTTGKPGVWVEEYKGERQVGYALQDVCTLDIFEAYKKTQYRALDSHGLDDVALAELGYGKTGLAGDELDDAWHNDPVEFFTYSIRDAQATAEIESTVGLLDLFENLREVTGAMYETAINNGPMLDTLFLRRAHESRLVLPSNTEPEEDIYHGARVFETVPGVHDNCVYPDLSSLYPSLFAMLNLGKETIIGDKDALEDSQYTEEDCYTFPVDERPFAEVPKGESYEHIDRGEYKGVKTPSGGTRDMFDPQYDWFYVLKPDVKESFITDSIEDLIDLKNEYTGDMYSAVKRVTNSCFTPDTSVVTVDGIRKITEVDVGDEVLSLNPDTMKVEVKPVTEKIERPEYRGELNNIQTTDIDLSVTPDHDMLVTNDQRQDDKWHVREAQDIPDGGQYALPRDWNPRTGEEIEEIDVTNHIDISELENDSGLTKSWNEYTSTFDADTLCKFIGWYVSEGTVSVLDYGENACGHRITITQKEGGKYNDDLYEVLDNLGIDWNSSDDRHHTMSNKPLGAFLIQHCGRLCGEKELPEFIWDLSVDQKRMVFDAMCKGDGDENRDRYYTTSEELRDDFVRLSAELGHNPRYRVTEHDDDNHATKYTISYSDTRNLFTPKRTENSTAENGVYCVQVEDNHTLLAGRNNKFQWVPNCYGVLGDSASGGKGSRLYNRRVAEGITLAGRLTITHTAETFTNYLNENYDEDAILVGGDTDSSTTSIPNAPDMETAWEWANEAVEFVDESYDVFAEETFDMPADDHRLEVELESLASKLFYMEGDEESSYTQNSDGFLVKQDDTEGVQKRYSQHLVWLDDSGWLDTADPDEGYEEALTDPEDRSDLKKLDTVTYDTYESGPLADQDPHSNVSITGFEYVRSDSAQVTRDAQMEVLSDILLREDPEASIEDHLSALVADVENGAVPLADLARPKGISQHLDEYGWKDIDELDDDEITDEVEAQGGKYRQKAGPTYRGAKYCTDWFSWEDLGEGSKPLKIPIEKVRGGQFPPAYQYHSFPEDESRPDPPEVDDPVDAIAVENPDRVPDEFVIDYDAIIEKELEEKLDGILSTMGMDWDEMMTVGEQTGLSAFS